MKQNISFFLSSGTIVYVLNFCNYSFGTIPYLFSLKIKLNFNIICLALFVVVVPLQQYMSYLVCSSGTTVRLNCSPYTTVRLTLFVVPVQLIDKNVSYSVCSYSSGTQPLSRAPHIPGSGFLDTDVGTRAHFSCEIVSENFHRNTHLYSVNVNMVS